MNVCTIVPVVTGCTVVSVGRNGESIVIAIVIPILTQFHLVQSQLVAIVEMTFTPLIPHAVIHIIKGESWVNQMC